MCIVGNYFFNEIIKYWNVNAIYSLKIKEAWKINDKNVQVIFDTVEIKQIMNYTF